MRAHLLLSVSLLKRNQALTLLPDANMQRFIRLSNSSQLGILTNGEWQWESKSISVQKRWAIYQSISNHTWIVFRIRSEEVKTCVTGEKATRWFWDRFCCEKNSYLQPDQAWHDLEIRCQASNRSGINSKPQGGVSSAAGELTSKLCSSIPSAQLWMKHHIVS